LKVVIVTNAELGWDNIVAVFKEGQYSKGELEKTFPRDNGYFIHHRDIDGDLSEFQG
jgi:hypothetical protein